MPGEDAVAAEVARVVDVHYGPGLLLLKEEQDQARGDWDSPRGVDQPHPPWPPADSPALRYLLAMAHGSLDAGMDPEAVLLQLAVHAWFEGGIENYDRGRRDAAARP